jgi:uncharacterized membrane protein (DUF2068 family)
MATAQAAPPSTTHESNTTIVLIAIFKLLKGVILVAVGFGALHLLHRDVGETVMRWVNVLRVDPDNRMIHGLVTKVLQVSPNQLKGISAGTFFYAALLLTEGTGLLLRKTWAEYFTVITTAGLIPLEIYEIVEHVTAAKIIVLIINAAIVVYLIVRIRSRRGHKPMAAKPKLGIA